MELGLGIHGGPGVKRTQLQTADKLRAVLRAVERASGLTASPGDGKDAVEPVVCRSVFCGLLHVEVDGGRMLHGPTRSRYRDAIVLRLRRGASAATTSGETRDCRSGEEKDRREQQLLQPLR